MNRNNIERPKATNSKKENKYRTVSVCFSKKYETTWKKSLESSHLSKLQFVIKLANDYADRHNLGINYIPMPASPGRKEGYNEYKRV